MILSQLEHIGGNDCPGRHEPSFNSWFEFVKRKLHAYRVFVWNSGLAIRAGAQQHRLSPELQLLILNKNQFGGGSQSVGVRAGTGEFSGLSGG